MWHVDNRTPFSADRGWVRDKRGAEVWLVAIKCTFDIAPDGATRIADDQPPVVRTPEYHGDAGLSSLRYESDLLLTKMTTDVIVNGHAYAPAGRPATEIDVGFRVGPVKKVLHVTGDRTWGVTGINGPMPFERMPLIYERAFGGRETASEHPERDFEWRNPVGTGFATSRGSATGRGLPNVEYPDEPVTAWSQRPRPAGFGPIGPHWQPRVGFAGTYGDRWLKTRQPLLPEDFDDRFFQCAPADQQAPHFLRGGEPCVLHRLTPSGDLRFHLPKVFLGFDTRFVDGTRQLHSDRKLHTVILEPDFPRVSLVWHSALPCHFKVQKLDRTIVTLKDEIRPRTPGGPIDDLDTP